MAKRNKPTTVNEGMRTRISPSGLGYEYRDRVDMEKLNPKINPNHPNGKVINPNTLATAQGGES